MPPVGRMYVEVIQTDAMSVPGTQKYTDNY